MPNISGSFTGNVRQMTLLALDDQPNHQLQVSAIAGTQRSPDPDWNDSRLNYWGTADLVNGSGTQHGYFANEHPDGGRDVGTFEGRITTSGNEVTLEGKFTFTGGTGKLTGIRGGGTYKGRITSPTTLEMSWSGQYDAAAGQAA